MWRYRGGDEAYVGEGGTQRGEEACRDIILERRHAEALQGERRHAEASLRRGGMCRHHGGEETLYASYRGRGSMWRYT